MILVDISIVLKRSHAKTDFLKTKTGIHTGMEFTTMRILEMLEKNYPDQQIVLCFDGRKAKQQGQSVDKRYKASRKPWDEKFTKRYNAFKKFLTAIYSSCEDDYLEADSIISSLAHFEEGPHYIYTSDEDLFQCIDDRRRVCVLKSYKSKLFVWNEQKVIEKYGVTPKRLVYLRAFLGDKSDELPGVQRISKRYLADMINWCFDNSIFGEEMIKKVVEAKGWSKGERSKLIEFVTSGQWMRNLELMTLAINPLSIQPPIPDDEYVVACLKKWEFHVLKLCDRYRDQIILSLENEEF